MKNEIEKNGICPVTSEPCAAGCVRGEPCFAGQMNYRTTAQVNQALEEAEEAMKPQPVRAWRRII